MSRGVGGGCAQPDGATRPSSKTTEVKGPRDPASPRGPRREVSPPPRGPSCLLSEAMDGAGLLLARQASRGAPTHRPARRPRPCCRGGAPASPATATRSHRRAAAAAGGQALSHGWSRRPFTAGMEMWAGLCLPGALPARCCRPAAGRGRSRGLRPRGHAALLLHPCASLMASLGQGRVGLHLGPVLIIQDAFSPPNLGLNPTHKVFFPHIMSHLQAPGIRT